MSILSSCSLKKIGNSPTYFHNILTFCYKLWKKYFKEPFHTNVGCVTYLGRSTWWEVCDRIKWIDGDPPKEPLLSVYDGKKKDCFSQRCSHEKSLLITSAEPRIHPRKGWCLYALLVLAPKHSDKSRAPLPPLLLPHSSFSQVILLILPFQNFFIRKNSITRTPSTNR